MFLFTRPSLQSALLSSPFFPMLGLMLTDWSRLSARAIMTKPLLKQAKTKMMRHWVYAGQPYLGRNYASRYLIFDSFALLHPTAQWQTQGHQRCG